MTTEALAELFTEWCFSYFEIPKNVVDVSIIAEAYKYNSKYEGSFYVDREHNIGKIDIYKSDTKHPVDIFKIMAHEFTHCAQWVDGRLDIDGDIVIFDGICYDRKLIAYAQQPWEIEAREAEFKLVVKFLSENVNILEAFVKDL